MNTPIEEAQRNAKRTLLSLTTAIYEGTDDDRKMALSLFISDFNSLCDAVENPF